MFELPEYLTLARQLNESVAGQRIRSGERCTTPP
jgi:hypothetical protein